MIQFDISGFPQPVPSQVFLVGGSVRDLLLNRRPTDYDIVVTENTLRYAEKLAAAKKGHLVKLGRPGQILYRIVADGINYDVTAAEGSSLTDDLQRRDFSINAIAYQLASGRIVDPFQGSRDLKKKQIRMVSGSVFRKDPVRLVRAFRLATDLGFTIESDTQIAIAADCNRISGCPGERVWTELSKILKNRNSHGTLLQMATSGVLNAILPELGPLKDFSQGNHHHLDAYDHTLATIGIVEDPCIQIDACSPDSDPEGHKGAMPGRADLLKLALLLHDVGKPATRQFGNDGRVHFYGHAAKSARMAIEACKRLRLSRRETDYVGFIVQHHLHPLALYTAHRQNTLSRKAIARFFLKCGRWSADLLMHALADMGAKDQTDGIPDNRFADFVDLLLKRLDDLNHAHRAEAPLLNGNDLIKEFGLTPGPLFRQILRAVQTAHLAGEFKNRSEALVWVKAWLDARDLPAAGSGTESKKE